MMRPMLEAILSMALLLITSAWRPASAYSEAPMLAARVAEGSLPPVEQRLPESPPVVKPFESIGTYGGTWRRVAITFFDILLVSRMGYETLVRWDPTGMHVVPGLAERYEAKDGGRTYVFHLRKGVRWSDGQPFTSEDIRFCLEDILFDKEVTPAFLNWLTIDRTPPEIRTPDPYTIELRFVRPYAIFPKMVAYMGSQMLAPKHYLKQYHRKYTPYDEVQRKAHQAGFGEWFRYIYYRNHPDDNPDLPTLKPFVLKVPYPAARVIAERNPYYWKVDPAGNQLPYIDRIVYTVVQNTEIANLKAMTGEVDFQARLIDSANYTLFMQNRQKGHYRVMADDSPDPTVLYVSPHSKNSRFAPILADARFRKALSVGINRDEIIDLIFSGMAVKSRGVVSPYDPHYLPEFDRDYLQYDPSLADRLLNEVGLRRGRDGIRVLADGTPFRFLLHLYPTEEGVSNDLWQLVADQLRDIGLEFTLKIDARALSVLEVSNGNTDFYGYSIAGMHWITDPMYYIPWNRYSHFAPLFGRYQGSQGRDHQGVKPTPEYQRLVDTYLEMRSTFDNPNRRLELAHAILRQWARQCYVIGIVRRKVLTIVSNRFHNLPDHFIHDVRVQMPGYLGIEQFYMVPE